MTVAAILVNSANITNLDQFLDGVYHRIDPTTQQAGVWLSNEASCENVITPPCLAPGSCKSGSTEMSVSIP